VAFPTSSGTPLPCGSSLILLFDAVVAIDPPVDDPDESLLIFKSPTVIGVEVVAPRPTTSFKVSVSVAVTLVNNDPSTAGSLAAAVIWTIWFAPVPTSSVATVPRPSDVRAVAPLSVTKLEPSPMMMWPSVGVRPATSSSCASCAWTSEPMATPRFPLAVPALAKSLRLFDASKSPPPGKLVNNDPSTAGSLPAAVSCTSWLAEFAPALKVAALPHPRLVRAVTPDSKTKLEPSPTMKLESVGVNPAMSASWASYAWTSVPMVRPSDVRAVAPLSPIHSEPSPTKKVESLGVNVAFTSLIVLRLRTTAPVNPFTVDTASVLSITSNIALVIGDAAS